jgi:hypothetical protein
MEIYNKLNTLMPSYVKKTFYTTNIQSRLDDTKKIIEIIIKETENDHRDKTHGGLELAGNVIDSTEIENVITIYY